jgi:hypothetical protein
MDPADTNRITEALKRLCDDDRSLILNWLILYYEDDGRMRSPRAKRGSLTLDDVPYYLVRTGARDAGLADGALSRRFSGLTSLPNTRGVSSHPEPVE